MGTVIPLITFGTPGESRTRTAKQFGFLQSLLVFLGESCAVGRFRLPRNGAIALLCGFAHKFSLPHKSVPIDTARPTLAAFAANAAWTFLVAAPPVDTHIIFLSPA